MDPSGNSTPHGDLAARLAEARTRVGMTQRALAKGLGITQQAVSRWEVGSHRPSVEQIPSLAAALSIAPEDLRVIAGYAASGPPRASHLPFDHLESIAFERLVADLALSMNPGATVRLEGARGHAQGGLDIRVDVDGQTIGIQCKQVARFGPAEVEAAISVVSAPVDRMVLALSRIASPRAAAAVRAAPSWELWDQDDLSRMIRALPGADQDRIVDTYFPGQRMVLLGRRESGPWLDATQFFAPFAVPGSHFNHSLDMQGRSEELAELREATATQRATLIVAPGGMGKSKLIKELAEAWGPSPVAIWFLSAAREPSRKSLEDLGPGEKLLVVDDAHDRDGLAVIMEFAADPANRTHLLLATRPYARGRIESELARFGFEQPRIVEMGRLPKDVLERVVWQVLEPTGISRTWAEHIAAIAGDNPLIATMAARVASAGGLSLAASRSDEAIRRVVVGKFADVITGSIASEDERGPLRAMLELMALVQPVRLDDRRMAELLTATTDVSPAQADRALRTLVRGGIVYRRGAAFRIMPDVLGDYLIDESCVHEDGSLTSFAERVMDAVGGDQLEQVMVNLGRMDWRRHEGDPSNSKLLDRAWRRLDDVSHAWDPRLGAVRSVAVFQPRQALDYVQRNLHRPELARELAPVLRNIAYTPEYRHDACSILWEMGRDDERGIGQHPDHPIRILAELCRFGEFQPLEVSEEIAAFAFDLAGADASWRHHYSPLDILHPLLSGVVEANRDNGRTFTLGRYFLDYDHARPLRSKVVDLVLSLLTHPNTAIAVRAARLIDELVRMPYGLGSDTPGDNLRGRYEAEFADTFARLREMIASGRLAAATIIVAIQGIFWYTQYGIGPLRKAARTVLAAVPDTPELRLQAALVDGAQRIFDHDTDYEAWSLDNPWLTGVATELRQVHGHPRKMLDAIMSTMGILRAAGINQSGADQLIPMLASGEPETAETLFELSRIKGGKWRPFAYHGLREILDFSPGRGRQHVAAALDDQDSDPDLAQRAMAALGGMSRQIELEDLALLRRGIRSSHEVVVVSALNALLWTRSLSDDAVFTLLMETNLEAGGHVFGALAHHLEGRERKLKERLRERDVARILGALEERPQLPCDHWSQRLLIDLAHRYPLHLARFVLDRADRAIADEAGEKPDPIHFPDHHFHGGKLGFHDAASAIDTLAMAWEWMLGHRLDDVHTQYRVAAVVATMFDVDARVVVEFLDSRLDAATPAELGIVTRLLRHTHHFFAFEQQAIVERLLERVAVADPAELDHVREGLAATALSGMRSGIRGEPMPRDLQTRDRAKSVLAKLSRFSPAWPLYDTILRNAEHDIASALREGEMLDDFE